MISCDEIPPRDPPPPVTGKGRSETEIAGSQPDISTWKTYRNEQYGFEVRYPRNWIINIDPPEYITLISPETEEANRVAVAQNNPRYRRTTDFLFSIFNKETSLDVFVSFRPNPQPITFLGVPAWETQGDFSSSYIIF